MMVRESIRGLSRLMLGFVALAFAPLTVDAQSYDINFIHTDHVDSPVAATSTSRQVVWTAHFSAYGKEYQGTGNPAHDPIGFAGASGDRQTGLVYMQARFYDPDIGRFLSVDPIGFTAENVMSFNRYLYVNNNPYAYVDPDGEILKAITTVVKVGYKAIKARKNPIKAIGDELVGAVDDAITLFDGQWGIEDIAAAADLVVGTDFNNKATRTSRAVTDRVFVTGKLSRQASDALRGEARDIWQATTGRRAIWDNLQVHHRVPLEWAHIFPKANPNRLTNLAGIDSATHTKITNAWNAWRRGLNGRMPTQAEIVEQALHIDKTFGGSFVFPK